MIARQTYPPCGSNSPFPLLAELAGRPGVGNRNSTLTNRIAGLWGICHCKVGAAEHDDYTDNI